MRSIDARVADLERLSGPVDNLTIFIVKFSGRDDKDEPIGYSTMGNGAMRWDRRPGESFEELKDRAKREVKRGASGVAVLLERYSAAEV